MPEPSFGYPPPEHYNFSNFEYLNHPLPQLHNNQQPGPYPEQLPNILPQGVPSQHHYAPESAQYDQPLVYNQGFPPQQPIYYQNQPQYPPQQQLLPQPTYQNPSHSLTIKLPAFSQMPVATRRSSRNRTNSIDGGASGSEYHESEKSFDHDKDADGDVEDKGEEVKEEEVQYTQSSRGRRMAKKVYKESDPEDDPDALFDDGVDVEVHTAPRRGNRLRRGGYRIEDVDDDDEEDEGSKRYNTRHSSSRSKAIILDEEDDVKSSRYPTRHRSRQTARVQRVQPHELRKRKTAPPKPSTAALRAERHARRAASKGGDGAGDPDGDDAYVQNTSAESVSDDGSLADAVHTSSEPEPEPEPEPEDDLADNDNGDGVEMVESDGKPYALRQRAKINYAIPPPLEETAAKAPPKGGRGGNGWFGNGRNERKHGGRKKGLGWSASGAELGRLMGMPADDSDSDFPTRTPRKNFAAGAGLFGTGAITGSAGGMGVLPAAGDLSAAIGTPSNLGKVGADSALADADPLGPSQNVTFDDVGGLEEHIHSLKEMTLLPLLYPEVFQNFGITPPRGVLFHGPPGTGKTLLARALAASCRSNGKGISFYMRKGADCLSKWVGEAERQLRLLFEEARNTQPSIIFFDEIDGLAPVRSSKQDQIHASIVSTLLALMDGMDGRGQVVVIGATNRPDAVDPALRRPGRFDREFYFGLPSLDARERILGIMTKKWKGWGGESIKGKEREKEVEVIDLDTPSKKPVEDNRSDELKDKLKGLAKLTKGYGGADLRALCTEAVLNAVQRRYPQIYKSTDRLLLAPETIEVQLRDFMISIKKIVPSSARSSVSAATPLPSQFVPLLSETLEAVKDVINRVLPVEKKRTALEEAEYEDEGEEGALDREMMLQSMEKLRVYRPRVVIHGPVGMGQGYIGAGALHHLEGFNIQSLELGTLLSDSTRTPDAAIVQLFIEAKRQQPSVIYVPSLVGWCAAINEASRATVRAMLDTLAPTDPILFLAVVDGPFSSLPPDVKAWFGPTRDNRVEILNPTSAQRRAFFDGLLNDVKRPPNMFPDGVKRRKRILENLPIAPPLEPRQPSAAELALQEETDLKIVTLLKYRLGPVLTELKRKFKRFTKRATEEYNFDPNEPFMPPPEPYPATTIIEMTPAEPNGPIEVSGDTQSTELVNGHTDPPPDDPFAPQQQQQVQVPQLYDMDLEHMHIDLYKDKYLTPQDFLDDVGKMVHNAAIRMHEDLDRLHKAQAMYTATQVSMQDFDQHFRMECDRMAARERRRREERRRQRDKERGVEDDRLANGLNGLATRRSARANGQQPEISITDPVKLERRLKRQRADGTNGIDSNGSEEEGSDRAPKRSRTVDGDGNEPDSLEGASETNHQLAAMEGVVAGPLTRQPTVHFADEAPATGVPSSKPPSLPPSTPPADSSMAVDSTPSKPPGFDPSLLNPVSREDNPFASTTPRSSVPPAGNDAAPTSGLPSRLSAEPPAATRSKSPTPMIIERSPTPPLPDFIVNEQQLSTFAQQLCDDTKFLSIEYLEQLRATCLGCVWRHRTEWDRGELIHELSDIAHQFVEEVRQFSLLETI
ncbi:hypothetical protein PLEOSDRAFT_1111948 [Pleurotus ostreatus PC15]|uniref:AAA+ ATPase domain-containing protein n=1 Tax=Pleurotus ostreatus (strain PC15) TaxID=1137138 RepID=A0A067NP73_PLEO1|nr:hypothetical protein PLEOSDRAFT_1111948 [Pleurotus ostreatus PC15]